MKSEKLTISNGDYSNNIIISISEFVKNKKIIIMPSDSIYGFLTLKINEDKLRIIKKRDEKPFLYLISDLSQLKYLKIDFKKHKEILDKYWPGKITFIMKNENNETVGVRFPEWNVITRIIDLSGVPLLSTSVNYSGMSAINDIDKIIKEFDDKADLIIIDRNFKEDSASTIVDIVKKPYKVLRKGSVVFEL